MTNLKAVIALVAVLISVTSLSHAMAQSSDVEATAIICSIDVQAFNSTGDYNNDRTLPVGTSALNFGTLEAGGTSFKRILEIQSTGDDTTTLRMFASDWNDFDGDFVMNGNQTRTTPRITDTYNQSFPLNSTGQYAPDGEGVLALTIGSINAARDGVILPTGSSDESHIATLSVRIPTGTLPPFANLNPDGSQIIDPDFQGSIHQDLTLQFEC